MVFKYSLYSFSICFLYVRVNFTVAVVTFVNMDPAKVVTILEGTMNPNLRKEAEEQLDQVSNDLHAIP